MTSISEAEVDQFWVNAKQGTTCPCCHRFAKVYVRKFNAGMARNLAWLYIHGNEYVHLPSKAPRRILTDNQVGKLVFWGMAEAQPNIDDPSKNKSGYWRITQAGRDFVEGKKKARSHVIEFNQKILGFKETEVDMSEVLGRPFNYQELLLTPA